MASARGIGKDDLALHWTSVSSQLRVGNYWHLLPEASQARKAIWTAVNPHTGKKRIDEAFPAVIRSKTNDHEMLITFVNGSTWQVVGSDNYDSLVGSSPIGIVFSEWALADPAAWAYLRPILLENSGWALFIYTPRGRNHGATFYEGAKDDPLWFADWRPAAKTGVFTPEQLAQERTEYRREYGEVDGDARYEQEYDCNFDVAVVGSYYGKQMAQAEAAERICRVPWEPAKPVITAWDVGVTDSTAIWFAQQVGLEVRLIDYYEAHGVGVEHYAKVLREKPYVYADCIWPHDVANKQMTTGQTLKSSFTALNFKGRILANESIEQGIQAARNLLPKCWFDREKCARGLDALRQYKRQWSDKLKTFSPEPLHDWASHGADAFRYLAKGLKEAPKPEDGRMHQADSTYSYLRGARQ